MLLLKIMKLFIFYKGSNVIDIGNYQCTFTLMNKKITLNNAFYGMNLVEMCKCSDVIGNDITDV